MRLRKQIYNENKKNLLVITTDSLTFKLIFVSFEGLKNLSSIGVFVFPMWTKTIGFITV